MKQVIKLLEDIQWFKNGHCPVCGAFTTNGHSKGCEIDQALAALALLEKQPKCETCGDKPRGVPAKNGGWTTCPDCQQPEATEFTRRFRILLDTQDKTSIVQEAYEACGKLDRQAAKIRQLERIVVDAKECVKITQERNNQQAALLRDTRLELACPETLNSDNEELYKVAATVVCEKHRLTGEIKRQEEEYKKAVLQLIADSNKWQLEAAEKIRRLEAMHKAAKGDLDDVMDGHKITDDLLIELQAEIKQLEEENRWIPVSERLPEVPVGPPNSCSEHVWLIHKGIAERGYYTNFTGWRIHGSYFDENTVQTEVTHWKPIVLPPQENEAKEKVGTDAEKNPQNNGNR